MMSDDKAERRMMTEWLIKGHREKEECTTIFCVQLVSLLCALSAVSSPKLLCKQKNRMSSSLSSIKSFTIGRDEQAGIEVSGEKGLQLV